MSISQRLNRFALGGVALALAVGVTSFVNRPTQEVQAMSILERLEMLEAAGTSGEGGIDEVSFDIKVIDMVMESLHDLEEAALLGLTSDDPEIVSMSEELLGMIEAEMDALMSMRGSRLTELLPMLRGTSRDGGIE